MRTLKFTLSILLFSALVLGSCIKHEVIPAPVPMVELNCHFQGTINGTSVEFTENVNGYYCQGTKAKIILPPPDLSSAKYYSEILSSESNVSIKVGLGSVMWDASTTSDPTLGQFNSFFNANTLPNYSDIAENGFEVTYRDGSGTTWVSKEASVNFQSVTFSNIKQEQDTTGDYSQFNCAFECYVYHTDQITLELDSLRIQSALFKGWFKR